MGLEMESPDRGGRAIECKQKVEAVTGLDCWMNVRLGSSVVRAEIDRLRILWKVLA